jgi:enoyl-CoA hydratase
MMSNYQFLDIVELDGVALVRIGHGDKLNAMGMEGHAECSRFAREYQADPSLRAAVITGGVQEGKKAGFSVGGSIEFLYEMNGDADLRERSYNDAIELVRSFIDLDKPIVSAVNGYAMGAGTVIALLCDFIVMEESARLADGHLRAAIAAGDGGTIAWPLSVGLVRAKKYLMTGDMIGAADALQMGLISEVAPDGASVERALDIARRLASGPQDAIRSTKRALNSYLRHGYLMGFEQALVSEHRHLGSPETLDALIGLGAAPKPAAA